MPTLRELFYALADDHATLAEQSKQACAISDTDIQNDLRYQSSVYLHWAQLEAVAEYECKMQDRTLKDVIIPDLRTSVRADFLKAGSKFTVDQVDDAMKLRPAYADAVRRLDTLVYCHGLIKSVCVALMQRKDMLVALNCRDVKELSQYPSR